MTIHRYFCPLYLLALFFIGLGHVAILPAFEGLDEIAHFSSIRQIADTHTIPVLGSSFLDEAAENYRGPVPYIAEPTPFHGPSYVKFFASPDMVENYRSIYRQSSLPAFRPGQEQNWQAQHPPLYYLVMAPVMKATESLSLVTQLLILRMGSFLIALAGAAFGLLALRQYEKPAERYASTVGFLLYPIFLPMFFPEFARLGNDSLCLFFAGLTAFLVSRWLNDENNHRLAVSVGVVLGLGLLTKAFFIPIVAALGVFLLMRVFSDGLASARAKGMAPWTSLVLIFAPALLIGGGWYVYKLIAFGNLIGSADAMFLAKQGGWVSGLKQNFSVYAVVRSIVAIFKSYVWAGTQSMTKLPAIFFIPSTLLILFAFAAFARELRYRRFNDLAWMPVLIFLFFGIGLFYMILMGVASSGFAGIPGWYLHILMPWFAPALGIGIISILEIHYLKRLFVGLLAYAVAFQVMAVWAQVALYTGCAAKTEDSFYAFPGNFFCLDQAPIIFDRLALLAWPSLAAIGFGAGFICFLLLLWPPSEGLGAKTALPAESV